jgi:GTP-binding protein
MKSFDLMFELGAEEWQLIFQQWFCKKQWMSDHWENVTDNVEALLIWLLKMYQLLKSEGTPQMLITSLDFSIYRSYRYWSFERGVLKEGMPISLVKEMVLYQNLVLKNSYFEGLDVKKLLK